MVEGKVRKRSGFIKRGKEGRQVSALNEKKRKAPAFDFKRFTSKELVSNQQFKENCLVDELMFLSLSGKNDFPTASNVQ